MKIRSGFVSNSSSSSFMIGIAKVKDRKKFDDFVKTTNFKYEDFLFNNDTWINKIKNNNYVVSGCVNYEPEVSIPLKEVFDENVVYFNFGNDEGDTAFYDANDDLDYDIDLDFFPEYQQKIYKGWTEDAGLENIDKTFGADRNG